MPKTDTMDRHKTAAIKTEIFLDVLLIYLYLIFLLFYQKKGFFAMLRRSKETIFFIYPFINRTTLVIMPKGHGMLIKVDIMFKYLYART